MTTEELRDIAAKVASVPTDDLSEFVDLTFDKIVEGKTEPEKDWIMNLLLTIGVDVRPLCRKKVPT